jgi:hypothetical protein
MCAVLPHLETRSFARVHAIAHAVPRVLGQRLGATAAVDDIGFNIRLAVVGMAMPVMMIIAEFRYAKSGDLAADVVVAVSGLASGIFVAAVNAWMNTPTGSS